MGIKGYTQDKSHSNGYLLFSYLILVKYALKSLLNLQLYKNMREYTLAKSFISAQDVNNHSLKFAIFAVIF